jgi:hypothetical protein
LGSLEEIDAKGCPSCKHPVVAMAERPPTVAQISQLCTRDSGEPAMPSPSFIRQISRGAPQLYRHHP